MELLFNVNSMEMSLEISAENVSLILHCDSKPDVIFLYVFLDFFINILCMQKHAILCPTFLQP